MSIELPTIPPQPNSDSTPLQWDVYLRILSMHKMQEQTDAVDRQTAQITRLADAAAAANAIGQQLLEQPQEQGQGFSEAGVLSLVSLLMRLPPAP